MDKKKLRFDLFKHIDGIALTAPLSCIFNADNKILNLLKKSNEFIIDSEKLESVNGDYLNVTLRLFESQGWLKRKISQENIIKIKTTKTGLEIFNHTNLYNTFFELFPYLIKLNFNDSNSHKKLNECLDKFDELKKETNNKTIFKHIEGLILGPTLVALSMNENSCSGNVCPIISKKTLTSNSFVSGLGSTVTSKLSILGSKFSIVV